MFSTRRATQNPLGLGFDATVQLSTLSIEVQFHIVDQLNPTNSEDLKALLHLGKTSQHFKKIVHDPVRVRKACERYLPLETQFLNNMEWTSLDRVTKFTNYQEQSRKLIDSIEKVVGDFEYLGTILLNGWKNILNVGLLLYAKMWHLSDRSLPDTGIFETFTPIQKIILMYCALLCQYVVEASPKFRGTLETLPREEQDWCLYGIRSWFLVGGLNPILSTLSTKTTTDTAFQQIRQTATYWKVRYETEGDNFTDLVLLLEREVEDKIYIWADQYVDRDLEPFVDAGIDEARARTLIYCLEVWSDDQVDLPWWLREDW